MDNNNDQHVTRTLDAIGEDLRRRPSVKVDVMRRVTEHAATGAAPVSRRGARRILSRVAAVAACAVVALLIWNPWGRGIGATEAFAQAIANVERARTFSCRQIVTDLDADGKTQVRETSFMFREPNLERVEHGRGMPMSGEYMVSDYEARRRLVVLPNQKIATVQDMSSWYAIEPRTGELKFTELGTHARDDVLRISAQAVKDLGMSTLHDQPVWVLQSEGEGAGRPVKTVYVNPQTGKPVQVDIAWPTSTFTYADIEIDTELDESLFSMEPPAGYAVQTEGPLDEHYGKMFAKVMAVVRECYRYRNKHDMAWPAELSDLTKVGMSEGALKTLLAPPDEPDGRPAIVYRRPADGQKEGIVVYEAAHSRKGGKVIAGYTDGHAQLLTIEEFRKEMKED